MLFNKLPFSLCSGFFLEKGCCETALVLRKWFTVTTFNSLHEIVQPDNMLTKHRLLVSFGLKLFSACCWAKPIYVFNMSWHIKPRCLTAVIQNIFILNAIYGAIFALMHGKKGDKVAIFVLESFSLLLFCVLRLTAFPTLLLFCYYVILWMFHHSPHNLLNTHFSSYLAV